MKCEEFELIGLDAGRDASLSELECAAAREHASNCPRCASLQDSWQAAGVELRAFSEATRMGQVSPRVELRLRQEFRTRHRTFKVRRATVVAAWALAAATVVVGAVSWHNWRVSRQIEVFHRAVPLQNIPSAQSNSQNSSGGAGAEEALVADNDLGDFTLLPGSLSSEKDDAAIIRVRMQRGGLMALGLPVNEERAGDWIQVDLLVGNDGLPQAVRLPEE